MVTKRLQVKRRRNVEIEIEANWALVAIDNMGEPAPQEQQDVEMPVEAPAGICVCEAGIGRCGRQ